MRRSTRIAFLFLIVGSSTGLAGSGGSGYSRHGLGDLQYGSFGRGLGMGGVGIALLPSGTIDPLNPATWAVISRTQFSVSALYEGFAGTDQTSSTYLSSAKFNGLMLAVPLIPSWGVILGAGITPFSRVNYNILVPGSQNGFDYTARYEGEGGISQGHLGVSAAPDSNLMIGVKLNYYFGTLRNTVSQTFPSNSYTNAQDVRLTRLDGIGATFGVMYGGMKKLMNLPPDQFLNVGAVFSTISSLNSAEERYYAYTNTSLTTRDTVIYPEGKSRLPFAAGGGISFGTDRYTLASDLYYQNWSMFALHDSSVSDLRDSYRFSLGAELVPKKESSAPFFQRLSYRLGFFYDASYYNIKGEPIDEAGIAGGFGIPILADTRMHIAAEYSFRGTADLEKDRIFRLSVTFSASERWFVHAPQE